MRFQGALAIASAATLLTGCVGGAAPEPSAGEQPEGHAAELVAYGDELTSIVDLYLQRLAAVEDEARDLLARDPDLLPGLLAQVGAATEAAAGELGALPPPPSLAARHQELVAVTVVQAEALGRVVTAADDADDARLHEALTTYTDGLTAWHRTYELIAEQLARDG
jgi:hypothetical protein